MGRVNSDPYYHATPPFLCEGEKQYVEVADCRQTVRRCRWPSKEPVEVTVCGITNAGCCIHDMAASPSGKWLVTQRLSGQGEWGYDVFRACPLVREAGVSEEYGYILELPRFSEDESRIVGGAGPGFFGDWWTHPDDDIDDPAPGGPVSLGFLFVHRLPSHYVTRHELLVELPKGWLPENPEAQWYGPQEITPTANGVRFMPSWGVPVEVEDPLPSVIRLPTPHPSGKGLLRVHQIRKLFLDE